MIKKTLILFMLLVLIHTDSRAQKVILLEKSTRENLTFSYQPGNRPEHQISNFIIKEIARLSNRNVMAIEYDISYNQDVTITREASDLVAKIIIRDFRLSGQTRVLSFDITDVLLPSRIEFSARIEYSGSEAYGFTQKQTSINPIKNTFSFEINDTIMGNRPTFNIKNTRLVYTTANRRAFSKKISLIEEYYYSDMILNQIFGDLYNIYPQNYKRCYEYRDILTAIGFSLEKIHQKDFPNNLNLFLHDPEGLMQKFSNASVLFEQKALEVDYVILNLPLYYYNDGIRLLQSNINEARSYFMQALEFDPNFAPAMAQIATLDFNEGYTDLAIGNVKKAYSTGVYDSETKNILQQISINIDERLISDAINYESDWDNHNALNAYLKAQDFCMSVPSVACKDLISRGISNSRKGIYAEMVEKSRQLFHAGNINAAENTIKQALNYQRSHRRDIPNANDAQILLNQIKEKQYEINISQGLSNLEHKLYQEALSLFEEARRIEEEFNVEAQPDLIKWIQQSKRPLLILSLEQAISKAKSNQLDQAKSFINNAENDIVKYGFVEDEEIKNLVITAKEEVLSQHCLNTQNQISKWLSMANDRIAQQKFLEADDLFILANDLNQKNLDCNIDFLPVSRRRAEVLPAINYQKMLANVDSFIILEKYQDAIELYNETARHYDHHGLSKFRLTHYTLYDFAIRQDECFILCVSGYFIHMNETLSALRLLNNLEQRKFPRRQTRTEQELLGKALALQDHTNDPSLNARKKVKEYTQGKRYYRYLRKAYIREFRSK